MTTLEHAAACDGPTNADRAEWAQAAVDAYASQTRFGETDPDDLPSTIADLIGDLGHLFDTIDAGTDPMIDTYRAAVDIGTRHQQYERRHCDYCGATATVDECTCPEHDDYRTGEDWHADGCDGAADDRSTR